MAMPAEPRRRSTLASWLTLLVLPWAGSGCYVTTESEIFGETDAPETCEIGSEGCPCTSGGKCNDPFVCNTNLDVCLADTCPVGTETCSCTPKGACDPGLMCASEVCVEMGCSPGAEACPCTEGGACDPGLQCFSGLCVEPAGDEPGGTTEAADESSGVDDDTAGDTTTGGASGSTG